MWKLTVLCDPALIAGHFGGVANWSWVIPHKQGCVVLEVRCSLWEALVEPVLVEDT